LKIIFFSNSDWYLFNFRLPLARALKAQGHEVLLISPQGDYGARLREEGFRWEPLTMDRRSLNPFSEIFVLMRLALLYRRERPDAVHHFTLKCVIYGSIASVFARIPARINAVAGMGYVFSSSALKARLLRPLVRGLMRLSLSNSRSRLILQNSDDLQAFTLANIVHASRIHMIKSSGVDTDRFKPGLIGAMSDQPTTVLLAARLLREKGINEFVESARKLRGNGLPIRFILAGAPDHGNPQSISQVEIDAYESEGFVEILGHVEDMRKLLAISDIVVLPSYYGEGVPRSLIEAAACGLPIVTTDSPGCREVVTHGVEGLLIPPRNSDALAEAIKFLHEDPQLRRKLGLAARQRAVTVFDQRIVIQKTLGVYGELITGFTPLEIQK
jgi:glycosyltransferase involved in cell wall biosynthesis